MLPREQAEHMMFLTIVLSLTFVLTRSDAAILQKEQDIVYPVLFDGRDESTRVLKINDHITLNLEPSSILHEDFFLATTRHGVPEHIYYDVDALEEGLYHDEKKFASVMLFEDDAAIKVEGVVGPNLKIRPLEEMGRSSEGHFAHVLEPIEKEEYHFPTVLGERLEEGNKTSERSGSIYDVEWVYPEVRLVADSAFMAGFSSYKKLVRYFMIEFNCINLRYRTVSRPKVRILLRSISVTKASTETYYVRQYGQVIDALKSLYNLVDYVEEHPEKYGKYDIVFFVTGLDMAAIQGSTVQTALQGFAFVGSVCLKTRVGLGEDKANTYIGIRIIAHELAHTLGCSHDGSAVDAHIKGIRADSNRCPWEQGYLMSYIENDGRSMKFSSCCDYSISLVAWSREITCLHNLTASTRIKKKYNTTKIPGDILGRTKQCKMTYPTLKKTYFMEEFGAPNCVAQCYVPGAQFQAADSHWPMILIDGTPCTKDKSRVCVNGDCVPKARRKSLQAWA